MRTLSNAIHRPISCCINWLQRIRPKKLYRCKAICIANTKQCQKSTEHIYCRAHEIIYREYHRMYHLYDNRAILLQAGMRMIDILEIELNLRKRFMIMFQLQLDEGHRLWNEFLEETLKRYANSNNNPGYELLLPYYGENIIRHWQKTNYINVETAHAFPHPTIAHNNEIFHTAEKINRTIIFKHFFDCKLDWNQPSDTCGSQQIQALDLTLPAHLSNI